MDLRTQGLNVWLAKYKILPGQNWEYEIQDARGHSRYLIPLFSSLPVLRRLYYFYVFNDSLPPYTSRLQNSHTLNHCLLLVFPCVHPFSADFQNV
jgi:hypothetical protein